MKGRDFFFDCFDLLYYKCDKINLDRGWSYIDSHDRIKNQKVTINPIKKEDNKSIQYALTVSLNHEEIGASLEKSQIFYK